MTQPPNFVVCPSFHGATLLSLLLNNHSQVSALGDTLPARTFRQSCSCGEKVVVCAFWNEISRRVDADRFVSEESLLPLLPRLVRNERLNKLLSRGLIAASFRVGPRVWRLKPSAASEFSGVYLLFYKTVCELHNTSVFVDGSKSIGKVLALRSMVPDETPIRVIHMVRDPRGFASSWRKNVSACASLRKITRQWLAMHRNIRSYLNSHAHIDYHRVRYEDLCSQPETELGRLFAFLGLDNEEVIGPPKSVSKHHLVGNKMIFGFDGHIRLDERWRQSLTHEQQDEIVRRAQPVMRELGYV